MGDREERRSSSRSRWVAVRGLPRMDPVVVDEAAPELVAAVVGLDNEGKREEVRDEGGCVIRDEVGPM